MFDITNFHNIKDKLFFVYLDKFVFVHTQFENLHLKNEFHWPVIVPHANTTAEPPAVNIL